MTDDDDLDDASLKSMRAVWLSMRDEEPPAAGMSALLAAAAEKADQMRDETQPWWQRALAFLRRPPALAFATVMVLIGGAVLVTRTSDKKTASEVAAPTPAIEEKREMETGSGVLAPPADEAEKLHALPPPPPPPPPAVEKPPVKQTTKSSRPKPKEEPPRPEPNRYDRFEDDKAKTGIRQGNSDSDNTKLETPGRVRDDRGAGGEPLSESIEVTGTQSAPPPKVPAADKDQQAPTIEDLAKQAESAAARGDCAAVKSIVARIKQLNEGFYRTRLGKSAAVTKCL
jgi:type IV secretory pathway VirB10-like protein